jgi:hypothetical protein
MNLDYQWCFERNVIGVIDDQSINQILIGNSNSSMKVQFKISRKRVQHGLNPNQQVFWIRAKSELL